MKLQIGRIVDQMSPEVRKEAEREARERGLTLDKFVESQLTAELVNDELDLRAARIRFDSWDARVGADPGGVRVGGGIRGRF